MNEQFAVLIAMDHFLNRLMTLNMFYHMIVIFHLKNTGLHAIEESHRRRRSIEKKMAVNEVSRIEMAIKCL